MTQNDARPFLEDTLLTSSYDNGGAWQGLIGFMVALMLALVALYFAVDFYKSYQRYVELRDHGVITEGWVEDRWTVGSSILRSHTNYYMRFKFRVDDRDYTFHQKVSEDTYGSYTFLPKVEIRYNPATPQHAVLKGTNAPDVWSLAASVGFGLAAIFVGIKAVEIQRSKPEISIRSLDDETSE